ncbi:hypothetical protein BSV1_I04 (plasmid) [Borreliella finlandensis]|uniref:Uncharacterized protein n=1 Tax=Borreliella finlandensis TaxID=498741 RepID=A0A806CN43_9SPIR|nr:hypothetical protein [Borreliella finlandensis]ACN93507.1 hypothetical protein BSV1_I04 [Borreliella finlandensis]
MLKAIRDFIQKDKLYDEILKFKQNIANSPILVIFLRFKMTKLIELEKIN